MVRRSLTLINIFLPVEREIFIGFRQFQQPKTFLIRLGKIGILDNKFPAVLMLAR
jgi:hypothetical protein